MFRFLQFTKMFVTIYFYVECQEWEKKATTLTIVLQKITQEFNEAIVVTNSTTSSLLHCSYVCERRASMSLYYQEDGNKCFCNNGTEVVEDITGLHSLDIFYGQFVRTEIFGYKQFTKWHVQPEKQDCYELYKSGYTKDGVYRIKPEGDVAVDTWCDMQNGGWTTIQQRYDGSENFTRGWSDYKNGFGHVTEEFWLGLDHLHHLAARPSIMFINMSAQPEKSPAHAHLIYYNVTIGGPSTNYTLNFPSYYSSCNGIYYSFYVQNGSQFTTIDTSLNRCANLIGGGWWFEHVDGNCGSIGLNGFYGGLGMMHFSCWEVSLAETSIKLRM